MVLGIFRVQSRFRIQVYVKLRRSSALVVVSTLEVTQVCQGEVENRQKVAGIGPLKITIIFSWKYTFEENTTSLFQFLHKRNNGANRWELGKERKCDNKNSSLTRSNSLTDYILFDTFNKLISRHEMSETVATFVHNFCHSLQSSFVSRSSVTRFREISPLWQ